MATAGANTVMEIEEQSELQPTLHLIVSQHDPITPENNHPLVICPQGESSPEDINPTHFLGGL